MRLAGFMTGVLIALVPLLASAAPPTPSFESIRVQQESLKNDVARGQGPFSDLSKRERNKLLDQQDEILRLIEGKDSIEQLQPDQQLALFNGLEQIKAAAEDAEQNRMICQSVKKTGSQMRVRECKTVAQREREREAARATWSKGSPCSQGFGCAD